MDNIQFLKSVQVRTTYLTLLLFFAIVAVFKKAIAYSVPFSTPARILILVSGVLSLLYHCHTAVELWSHREAAGINAPYKKRLFWLYSLLHGFLVVYAAIITWCAVA